APQASADVALALELWRERDELDVAPRLDSTGQWVTVDYRGQRYLLYTYREGMRLCGRGGPIADPPTKEQLATAASRPSHTFKDLSEFPASRALDAAEIASWGLPGEPSWLPRTLPQ